MPYVNLFITCLVDTFYPQTAQSIIDIFSRLGIDVFIPPGQTCCGQPSYNGGMRDLARPAAEHTIQVFEALSGPVIIPSGSCAVMIKHGYPELFEQDPAWLLRAHALGERTFEFTEYLVDVLGVTDLGAQWNGKLTYHASCHPNRHLGIDRQPRALLANVQGAELIPLPSADDCCGFGGVFSIKHPELSVEMIKRKLSSLDASGSPTLVVTEAGCRMNIAGAINRQNKPQRVVHIAEVLNHRES